MNPAEAALALRLRRMQWLATGLLAVMALSFVLTSFWRREIPALGALWAFSEAALIGGLADWFAITALFRRPLGLPIPHTAIIPNRKDAIGRALARFVAEHFLVADVLAAQLARFDIARSFGRWLERPENTASAARDAARALDWLLRDSESGPLREAFAGSASRILREAPIRPLLAALFDVLASGPHAGRIVNGLVAFGRDQLDRNRDAIRARIHDRSPWWLPRFVDEEIYDQIVGEMERILTEIGDDDEHPARQALRERLAMLEETLAGDPGFADRSRALRDEFLGHPAVAGFGHDVAARAQADLSRALADPGSELRRGIERELAALGSRLVREDAVAARLDAWLVGLVVYLVETYREPISSIISATIEQWDADATARRIELNIGRDLQFIRINGTLVGGLVGLVLYLSWTAGAG